MNSALRLLNSLLLIAILATLLLIWRRMPPTFGEMKAANPEQKKTLWLNRPLVRTEIPDPVSVSAPVEVVIVKKDDY